jgi:hypothetical protein
VRDNRVPLTALEDEVVFHPHAVGSSMIVDPRNGAIRPDRDLTNAKADNDVAALVTWVTDPRRPTEEELPEMLVARRASANHLLQPKWRVVRIVSAHSRSRSRRGEGSRDHNPGDRTDTNAHGSEYASMGFL